MNMTTKSSEKCTSLKTFLNAHVIPPNNPSNLPVTMTEFSKYSKRKFHIKSEDEDEFQRLYNKDHIKPKIPANLIQRQLIEDGAQPGVTMIDLDFRFPASQTERYYTKTHVEECINMYLKAIQNLCEMDEDVHFPIIVMEKPAPRVEIKNEETVVKDGVHIIFNLEFTKDQQLWLQRSVVSMMKKQWEHFPLKNNFEDVLDDSIPSGKNGWLLPFSQKQDDVCYYEMTSLYNVHYDLDDNEWKMTSSLTDENKESLLSQHYKLMFPRYKDRPSLLVKDSMLPELQQFKQQYERKYATADSPPTILEDMSLTLPMILSIQSKEDLDACVSVWKESLHIRDHSLREARELAMCLPDNFYEPGSYTKWIETGFTLHNISKSLLIVWIEFSAQSSTFSYSQVTEIVDTWHKMVHKKNNKLTIRSLVYWAKQENPEAYEKIQLDSLKHAIDMTVETTAPGQNTKKGAGATDCDLAHVVNVAFRGQYVCAGIKDNVWFQFTGDYWTKSDSGTSLRKSISNILKPLYHERGMEVWQTASKHEPDTDEHKKLMIRASKYMDIGQRLGSSSDKDKIMKEAKELFYDPMFLDKLDQNKYIFGCANGVIDFKEKRFRKGNPEDYLSIHSTLDYNELDEEKDKDTLNAIKHYVHTLFPIPDTYEYALHHFASLLIGDTTLNQCLHYYTGIGKNGKSALIQFLCKVLGGYANELDASFYTSERQKRGASSPELYALRGKRLAYTSEISENEKMNEGPMKQLTSGTDTISCRPLFGQLVQFIPQVNAVLAANYYLKISSRDFGTWRRIRVLKFVSTFTDNPTNDDPDKPYQFPLIDRLDEKFDLWAPVMLSWMVQIAFETGGVVKMCTTVKEESEKYQKKEDYLMEFSKEFLVNIPGGELPKGVLCKEFNEWYRVTYSGKGNRSKEAEEYMDKQYGEQVNFKEKSKGRGWKGVMLKKFAEMEGLWNEVDGAVDPNNNDETDEEEDEEPPVHKQLANSNLSEL